MNMKANYETKDFYIACLFRSLGIPVLRLRPSESNFIIFEFSITSQKAEEIIQHYWNRQLQVEPRALIDAINELKTRLHTHK